MDRAAALHVVETILRDQGMTAEEAFQELKGGGLGDARGQTVAEFVPKALKAVGAASTQRTWEPPLRFLAEGWSVPPAHVDLVKSLAEEETATWPDSLSKSVRLPLWKCDRERLADPQPKPLPTDHVRVFTGYGTVPLADLSMLQLVECRKWIRVRARLRNDLRADKRRQENRVFRTHTGAGAEEHFISATRKLFRLAGWERTVPIQSGTNPALDLGKPAVQPSGRRILTDHEVHQMWDVVRMRTDAELDSMIVRFHLGACARKEGTLNLRLCDIDVQRSTVRLDEKNGKIRITPVAPSLIEDLLALAASRGATTPTDHVLCYANGRPVTSRRWDALFIAVQDALPWAAEMPLTAHALRHHAAASMERARGHALAQAFLGHAPADVTGTYVKATLAELAEGVQHLNGEPHPLAPAGSFE